MNHLPRRATQEHATNLRTIAITVIAMTSLAMPASTYAMQRTPDSPPLTVLGSVQTTVDHGHDGCFVSTQNSTGPGSSAAADHTYPVSGAGSSAAADRYIQDCQIHKPTRG